MTRGGEKKQKREEVLNWINKKGVLSQEEFGLFRKKSEKNQKKDRTTERRGSFFLLFSLNLAEEVTGILHRKSVSE